MSTLYPTIRKLIDETTDGLLAEDDGAGQIAVADGVAAAMARLEGDEFLRAVTGVICASVSPQLFAFDDDLREAAQMAIAEAVAAAMARHERDEWLRALSGTIYTAVENRFFEREGYLQFHSDEYFHEWIFCGKRGSDGKDRVA